MALDTSLVVYRFIYIFQRNLYMNHLFFVLTKYIDLLATCSMIFLLKSEKESMFFE